MTGLDTNVLIRIFFEDDPAQADRIRRFLKHARGKRETVYVSLIVLCETAWVLRASLGKSRGEIASVFEKILDTDVFQVEQEQAVRAAVQTYRNGPGDFSDCLIGQPNLA